MMLISDGKCIQVPERLLRSKLGLLNYRQTKGSSVVKVEDCLPNRLVLENLLTESCEIVDSSFGRYNSELVELMLGCDILDSLKGKLRDYQIYDIKDMASKGSVLNRNPMGSGKTVEAVALMRVLKVKSALIVAPKSVVYQWQKTIEEWYPEAADRVLVNTYKPRRDSILIYNYEKLSRNENLLEKVCGMGPYDIHICDEAHRLKNKNSKRTLAMKVVPSKRRVALTGTPWTNKPNDLWSLLNWLNPFYSGSSYWNFTYYFCNIKRDFWGEKVEGLTKDQSRVELLKKLILRVSVCQPVSVSAGKQTITVPLEMEKNQRTLYEQAKQLVLDELPSNMTIANGAVLTMRLQQVSSWPGMFDSKENKKKYGAGIKFEWIKDLVEDNPDKKFVVFTRFATVAKALTEYLSGKCVTYIGEMNSKERDAAKQIFIDDPEIRVIIGTIGAMGEGVDGLQYASSTCIFIDRDWNPSVMEQAEDRLNRFGQTNSVICYYLECEKSFDQHVGRVNLKKSEDIRLVLKEED